MQVSKRKAESKGKLNPPWLLGVTIGMRPCGQVFGARENMGFGDLTEIKVGNRKLNL